MSRSNSRESSCTANLLSLAVQYTSCPAPPLWTAAFCSNPPRTAPAVCAAGWSALYAGCARAKCRVAVSPPDSASTPSPSQPSANVTCPASLPSCARSCFLAVRSLGQLLNTGPSTRSATGVEFAAGDCPRPGSSFRGMALTLPSSPCGSLGADLLGQKEQELALLRQQALHHLEQQVWTISRTQLPL